MTTEVWLIEGNCGDYYCEGNHVVGIYASENDATEAKLIVDQATYSIASHDEPRRMFPCWHETEIVRVTMGEIPPFHELRGQAKYEHHG